MPLGTPKSATLGSFNVGLAAAIGFLNPLGIQIDALLAAGLGPFTAQLSAQLNASLAAQATLAIQFDPTANIRVLANALVQLQAALEAALVVDVSVGIQAELNIVADLAATLAIQLGGLRLAIEAALAIKIPALALAAELQAHMNATVFGFSFDGDTLATTGGDISTLFNSGLVDGAAEIGPGETVGGVVLLGSATLAIDAIFAIITIP